MNYKDLVLNHTIELEVDDGDLGLDDVLLTINASLIWWSNYYSDILKYEVYQDGKEIKPRWDLNDYIDNLIDFGFGCFSIDGLGDDIIGTINRWNVHIKPTISEIKEFFKKENISEEDYKSIVDVYTHDGDALWNKGAGRNFDDFFEFLVRKHKGEILKDVRDNYSFEDLYWEKAE